MGISNSKRFIMSRDKKSQHFLKLNYSILQNKDLRLIDAVLLSEITQLSRLKLGCFISNAGLSRKLNIPTATIARSLKKLINLKLVYSKVDKTTDIPKRTLTLYQNDTNLKVDIEPKKRIKNKKIKDFKIPVKYLKQFKKLENNKTDFKLSLSFYDKFLKSEPVDDIPNFSKLIYFCEKLKRARSVLKKDIIKDKIAEYYAIYNKNNNEIPF